MILHLLQGSARQLFQRLQDPVEEDALKEHFDKIIQIAQRQHQRRIQVQHLSSVAVIRFFYLVKTMALFRNK